MCGFAGVIAWDEQHRIRRDALEAMGRAVAHRGPDGQGFYLSRQGEAIGAETPQAALAFRRLAVLDPDPRANQPFQIGGLSLVFNGEIYNFRELREELKRLRPEYAWRSTGDTEVLLLAYEQWREKCLDRLNGMFALAVWDEPRKELFLARDRMGQKPLYLWRGAAGGEGGMRAGGPCFVAFASELAALRAVPWFDASIDEEALIEYLRFGCIGGERTIYTGVEKLLPGTWLRIGPDGGGGRYFDPNALEPVPDDASVVPRTRELVMRAVGRQLVSDVPLGCFLSGGIDSSIIAAAMKASVPRGQEVLTFSIGFDDPRYDETGYAAEVAQHLGTVHQRFIVHPRAAEDLPRLAEVFGEPFGDSSALPTHYLSQQTRQRVKVALSGDGGDELFGGYDRYRALWLGESFARMPAGLRRIAVSKLWQMIPGSHPKSLPARAKRMLASLNLPAAQRYESYMRLFSDRTIAELLGREEGALGTGRLAARFDELARERDVVRAAMALDRVSYLPDDLLVKVDRASMLHALEVRSPFMDHELVRFAASLSTAQLYGHGISARGFMDRPPQAKKRLLNEAFGRDLPEQVFARGKMGFAVPIGEWFRGELRGMLREHLFAAGSLARARFKMAAVERLIDEHEQRREDHSQRLYALLMLELWWAGQGG